MLNELKDLSWLDAEDMMKGMPIRSLVSVQMEDAIIDAVLSRCNAVALSAGKAVSKPYTRSDQPPTRSGRTLTDAEMRLQMNFLTKLIEGSVADVEKNANRTGFADIYAEVRMPEWLENSFKERLGIFIPRQFMGCSHNAAAVLASVKEVRGFDDDVRLSAPMEPMEHVYYSELKKIRSLISSAVSTGSADTQRHYRLMLYKIDQALK